MKPILLLPWLTPALLLTAGCASLPEDHAPGRVDRLPGPQAAALAPAPALTLADIEAMQKDGVAAEAIVARIRDRGATFRLSAADVLRLNRAKVPDSVIDFMLNAERSAAQENCAGELARIEREFRLRLTQREQDWRFRCDALYPPFHSPFYPYRRYWW